MNDHVVGLLIAVPFIAIVTVLILGAYRLRTRHVVRQLPDSAWGNACIDPANPRAWRVLVIDDDGVKVEKGSGKVARSWSWSQITGAERADLRVGPAVVSHRGIDIILSDGSKVGFQLLGPAGVSFPPELVDEALNRINRHRH